MPLTRHELRARQKAQRAMLVSARGEDIALDEDQYWNLQSESNELLAGLSTIPQLHENVSNVRLAQEDTTRALRSMRREVSRLTPTVLGKGLNKLNALKKYKKSTDFFQVVGSLGCTFWRGYSFNSFALGPIHVEVRKKVSVKKRTRESTGGSMKSVAEALIAKSKRTSEIKRAKSNLPKGDSRDSSVKQHEERTRLIELTLLKMTWLNSETEESVVEDGADGWENLRFDKSTMIIRSIPMFQFLIDPKSFAKTVENFFHFSFVVKTGFAGIEIGERREPLVYASPNMGTEEASNISSDKFSQFIAVLDFETWKRAIKLYDLKEAVLT